MEEILSASSIFLAFLGLIYNSWYPEINNATKVQKNTDFKEDNKKIALEVKNIIYYKALPITIFSLLLSLILLPEIFEINLKTIFKDYNAVELLFFVIVIFSIIFTIHLIIMNYFLIKNYLKLNK